MRSRAEYQGARIGGPPQRTRCSHFPRLLADPDNPTGPVPNGARLSLGEVSGTALAAGFAWENIAQQYRWLALRLRHIVVGSGGV